MDKQELIKKVCNELRSHIAYLEWPGDYDDNEAYRRGLEHAAKIKVYIEELKKLTNE